MSIFLSSAPMIQKIYTSYNFLSFNVRYEGKTHFLYLGRGGGYEGLFIRPKQLESFHRQSGERGLALCRKYLMSAIIEEIQWREIKDQWVVQEIIFYQQKTKRHLFIFYADHFLHLLFWEKNSAVSTFDEKSAKRKEITLEESVSLIEDFLTRLKAKEIKAQRELLEFQESFLEEGEEFQQQKSQKKQEKFLKRKIKNIEEDLKKSRLAEELQEISEKESYRPFIKENKFIYKGIKFHCPEKLPYYQQRNLLFEKSKKLKRGAEILEKRLQDVLWEYHHLKEKEEKKEKEQSKRVKKSIDFFYFSKKDFKGPLSVKEEKSNLLEFFVASHKAAMGRDARENDFLRSKWAGKNDFWFHLKEGPSSHLVVKVDSASLLTEEAWQEIAGKLSGRKEGEVDLIYTEVKNLKAVKGAPGKVLYKKEKHRRVYLS